MDEILNLTESVSEGFPSYSFNRPSGFEMFEKMSLSDLENGQRITLTFGNIISSSCHLVI